MTRIAETEPRSYLAEIERLKDLAYLPKREEIISIFGGYLRKKFKGSPNYVATKSVHPKRYAEEVGSYELLNQEFISALSQYLEGRITELGGTPEKPTVILETGAGTGRLAHFLTDTLEGSEVAGCFSYYSVDDGSWGCRDDDFSVKRMDYRKALGKFNPDIVVASWMVPSRNWAADYRATPSVSEYLLIGKPGSDAFSTCGSSGVWRENTTYRTDEIGGFQRFDLGEISKFQIGCLDDLYPYSKKDRAKLNRSCFQSKTVSFRRV